MKILIVDDSVVFRTAIKSALEKIPGVEIVGVAPNGKIALDKVGLMQVDLLTLDLEMPDLDGIQTLKVLREKFGRTPRVVVFSATTTTGAERAIEALNAGADEVLAKPAGSESAGIEAAVESIRHALAPVIEAFRPKAPAPASPPSIGSSSIPAAPQDVASLIGLPPSLLRFRPKVLTIASSTGGPPALEKFFAVFKGAPTPRVPIVICQHMPPVFTASLAKRLGEVSGLAVHEGRQGEEIKAGRVYVAPGDYHMIVSQGPTGPMIRLHQEPHINYVRPSADPLFQSATQVFGASVLGVVFTGMGNDGAQGAVNIKTAGGKVLIQDEASCIVFGMPGAVKERKAFDGVANPIQLGEFVRKMVSE